MLAAMILFMFNPQQRTDEGPFLYTNSGFFLKNVQETTVFYQKGQNQGGHNGCPLLSRVSTLRTRGRRAGHGSAFYKTASPILSQ